MRFWLLIALAVLATQVVTTGGVIAQSETESDAAEEGAKTEKKKPELTEDQKELDKKLLGAWAQITSDINAQMSEELFRKAAERCLKPPKITRLDAEPGLKNPLPGREDVRGEVIYYRTDQGLQRFQTGPGSIFLLPDMKKDVNAGGQTVWQVSGKYAAFVIAFAEARQGADVLLMVEQDRLYLKCGKPPRQDD